MREVVDGQQRLRTIISFIAPNLIKDLVPKRDVFKIKKNHNSEYSNMTYSDLPDKIKRQILDYEFFVHVLSADVSDIQILEIFSRMNSTGVNLKEQEVRNANYYGEFKTLMYKLAIEYYSFWIKTKIFTDNNIARMDEVEMVNDFAMLILDGVQKRSPKLVDSYYKKYDNEGSLKEKNELVKRIKKVIEFIDTSFGNQIQKSNFKKKPLFLALFTAIYDLMYGLKTPLKKKGSNKLNPTKISKNLVELDIKIECEDIPIDVLRSFSKGTNSLAAKQKTYVFIKSSLKDV